MTAITQPIVPAPPSILARPVRLADVSRFAAPWRWTNVVQWPLELLAVAWSIPVVILAVMLPVGLAGAFSLWLARLVL